MFVHETGRFTAPDRSRDRRRSARSLDPSTGYRHTRPPAPPGTDQADMSHARRPHVRPKTPPAATAPSARTSTAHDSPTEKSHGDSTERRNQREPWGPRPAATPPSPTMPDEATRPMLRHNAARPAASPPPRDSPVLPSTRPRDTTRAAVPQAVRGTASHTQPDIPTPSRGSA